MEVGVVGLEDVVDERGWVERIDLGAGRVDHGGELIRYRGGVELRCRGGIGQRAVPVAAVVEPELLEDTRSGWPLCDEVAQRAIGEERS